MWIPTQHHGQTSVHYVQLFNLQLWYCYDKALNMFKRTFFNQNVGLYSRLFLNISCLHNTMRGWLALHRPFLYPGTNLSPNLTIPLKLMLQSDYLFLF